MRKLSPPVLGNANVSHLEVWQLGHSRPQFFSRCFQHSENPANIIHEKSVCTRIIRRGLRLIRSCFVTDDLNFRYLTSDVIFKSYSNQLLIQFMQEQLIMQPM